MTEDSIVCDMITTIERACRMMRKLRVRKHAKLDFSFEVEELGVRYRTLTIPRLQILANETGSKLDANLRCRDGGDVVRVVVRRGVKRA